MAPQFTGIIFKPSDHIIDFQGDITLGHYHDLMAQIPSIIAGLSHEKVSLNFSSVATIDTAGALVIRQLEQQLTDQGIPFIIQEVPSRVQQTLALVPQLSTIMNSFDIERPPAAWRAFFTSIGRRAGALWESFVGFIEFLGLFLVNLWESLCTARSVMLPGIVSNMASGGIAAIPIVMVTSFVVGVVLSYEGIVQLSKFGAQSAVIALISLSVLREAGVLITAIVVAGRSGSAFAAEIGTMKVNEELDALRIMGLNPIHLLVVPRVLALMIFMPILTLLANVCGLFGGAVITLYEMDINFTHFFLKVQEIATVENFLIGMLKAPFFGMLIGMIGCMEGLLVTGNAESVGRRTTVAVVKALFCVIIFNSIFSVLVSYFRIGV